MPHVDPNPIRPKGLWATLATAAVTSAFAVTVALPATSTADPEPAPPAPTTHSTASPSPTTTTAPPGAPASPQPQPGDPNATPPPPPVDPNAPPPPPVDPNAGRIPNAVGGFSFVLPGGWVESDATRLDYGSELLSKVIGPGQPPQVANDTRIVMGRLDQKLYASAEASNSQAAVRLGSDMGEFFMPYPGTRMNQATAPLTGANAITGSSSYYEVKFSDPSKPNGQIWAGVVGSPSTAGGPPHRWFVVWLGTSNDPVDQGAAKALAESIQAWEPPPNQAPAPGAPAPGPGAPAPGPAAPAPAPAAPAPAPAGPAPAPGAPA